MAFYTIFVAPDLPAEARRRARQAGPSSVYSRAEQQALLRSAGFVHIMERDVTDEYLRFQRKLIEANNRHADAIRKSIGPEAFDQRLAGRQASLSAIKAGLLRRSLFVAERPE
jgi:hypothetical protein